MWCADEQTNMLTTEEVTTESHEQQECDTSVAHSNDDVTQPEKVYHFAWQVLTLVC